MWSDTCLESLFPDVELVLPGVVESEFRPPDLQRLRQYGSIGPGQVYRLFQLFSRQERKHPDICPPVVLQTDTLLMRLKDLYLNRIYVGFIGQPVVAIRADSFQVPFQLLII